MPFILSMLGCLSHHRHHHHHQRHHRPPQAILRTLNTNFMSTTDWLHVAAALMWRMLWHTAPIRQNIYVQLNLFDIFTNNLLLLDFNKFVASEHFVCGSFIEIGFAICDRFYDWQNYYSADWTHTAVELSRKTVPSIDIFKFETMFFRRQLYIEWKNIPFWWFNLNMRCETREKTTSRNGIFQMTASHFFQVNNGSAVNENRGKVEVKTDVGKPNAIISRACFQ